jgi:hypothetical protein
MSCFPEMGSRQMNVEIGFAESLLVGVAEVARFDIILTHFRLRAWLG